MKYDITKPKAPTMPTLGKGTECIRLLLSQTSKDMHDPLVPMLFPILGAHMSGSEFQYPDLTWKEPCGQITHPPQRHALRRTPVDRLQNHQQGLEIKRAYLHGDSVVTPSQVHEKVLHRHRHHRLTHLTRKTPPQLPQLPSSSWTPCLLEPPPPRVGRLLFTVPTAGVQKLYILPFFRIFAL